MKGVGTVMAGSRILLLILGVLLFHATVCAASGASPAPPVFIAHAGGGYDGKTYTNSLEALEFNYGKGFRFFEIDFSWTSDGELVAIHDWDKSFRRRFGLPEPVAVPTKSEFLELKSPANLTQLSLEDVLKWTSEKKDAFIVTDVKDENLKALKKISEAFREYRKFVVPQVYSYREYDEAVGMGYEDVILTIYRMKLVPSELFYFARKNSPFAITMPWKAAEAGLAYYLNRMNITVYAHTVNDLNHFNSLRQLGVFGVYTDFIVPP